MFFIVFYFQLLVYLSGEIELYLEFVAIIILRLAFRLLHRIYDNYTVYKVIAKHSREVTLSICCMCEMNQ